MLATLPAHLRSQVTAESTSSVLALFALAVSILGGHVHCDHGRARAGQPDRGRSPRYEDLCVSHTAFDYPLKSDLGAEVGEAPWHSNLDRRHVVSGPHLLVRPVAADSPSAAGPGEMPADIDRRLGLVGDLARYPRSR